MPVCLEVGLLAIDDLGAVVFTAFDDEELFSSFSLLNHTVPTLIFFLGHRLNQGLFVLPIDVLEKYRVPDEGFDEELGFLTLWDFVEDD